MVDGSIASLEKLLRSPSLPQLPSLSDVLTKYVGVIFTAAQEDATLRPEEGHTALDVLSEVLKALLKDLGSISRALADVGPSIIGATMLIVYENDYVRSRSNFVHERVPGHHQEPNAKESSHLTEEVKQPGMLYAIRLLDFSFPDPTVPTREDSEDGLVLSELDTVRDVLKEATGRLKEASKSESEANAVGQAVPVVTE